MTAGPLLMRSRRTFLAVLFLAALLIRFGAVLGLRDIHKFHSRTAGGTDAVEFNAIALNLAAGRGYASTVGYPTSFRAPGMPFFLSALYRISYQNYELGYLALIAVGALTCLITYFAAREILSENWARAAGILAAVYLPHVYFSTIFLSEVLFAFCVGLGLWLVLVCFRKPSGWLLAGAGLALGYGALARPIGLLLPVFLLPALVRWSEWRALRLIRIVPLLLAAAAVILPWSLRNYALYHHWVLIATNGGSTFYGANNDITLHDKHYLGSWIATNYLPGRKAIEATPDEYTHDQLEWKLGKQWVASHWIDMPLLTVYKMARFWLPDFSSGNRMFVLMQVVGYTPVGILIVLGLYVSLRRGKAMTSGWLAVHGILAANLVSTVVFYGSGRFRDSITPVLMIYAAAGLEKLAAFRFQRSHARP